MRYVCVCVCEMTLRLLGIRLMYFTTRCVECELVYVTGECERVVRKRRTEGDMSLTEAEMDGGM